MDEKDLEIATVSMQVIINSCNGRDKVDEAFARLAEFKFDEARALLDAADEDMLKAHNAQTSMIQAQAAGEDTEYSLLFVHAQDTLMTSDAQMRIARNMIAVVEGLYQLATR